MSFNCPEFVKEFSDLVSNLNIKTALEIGYGSAELVEALRQAGVEAEGVDKSTELSGGKAAPYLYTCDMMNFRPGKKYDLVYSSGVIEHFDPKKAQRIIRKMASLSNGYVLNLVPNSGCLAYVEAKANTTAPWRDEFAYTQEELRILHEAAGLEVVSTGYAGAKWVERFGPAPSEPYLVYCLAKTV